MEFPFNQQRISAVEWKNVFCVNGCKIIHVIQELNLFEYKCFSGHSLIHASVCVIDEELSDTGTVACVDTNPYLLGVTTLKGDSWWTLQKTKSREGHKVKGKESGLTGSLCG